MNTRYEIEEIPHFLTKEECQTLIELAQDRLYPSKVLRDGGDIQDVNARNSKQCFLKDDDHELVKNISQCIANRTKTDIKLQEQLQVVKYDPDGFFTPHFDAFNTDGSKQKGVWGDRYITFIMYLNDNFRGGETFFPTANETIVPEMCKAALFYNITKDGVLIQESMHSGMKVKRGVKWIANKWIHLGPSPT
jgi:prolyl 4-hydroxylase